MNTTGNNSNKYDNTAAMNRTPGGTNTKMLIMTAIFAAVTAVCSQIQIPLAPVPINLATFAVFVTAGLLGSRWGTISLTVYVLLGAAGLPVFAGFQGGFGKIAGPTGGYIIGYILAAFVTGLLIEYFSKRKVTYPLLALSMVTGLAICYILGTIWFIHLTGWTLGKALMTCVVVFLPGDALKIIAASILVKRVWPAAIRFRG